MIEVRTERRVTEAGFRGIADFVHAEPGDVGRVEEVADAGPDWLMVRWPRQDSVTMTHLDEITVL